MRRFRLALLLAPAVGVVVVLFLGGLGLGLVQSLGYFPVIGMTDLTLRHYVAALTDREFTASLALTAGVATAVTAISTVLAIAAALCLRRDSRAARVVAVLFQLPLPVPHLVIAICVLLFFSQGGLIARLAYALGLIGEPAEFPVLVQDRNGIGIVLSYAWKEVPFVGLIVLALLREVGHDYEELARTLGASPWQRLRYVIIPLIVPGVISSSVIVFAYTFGAFEVPYLLGAQYPAALPVLAFRNYTDVDLRARPEALALSLIIALIITTLVFGYMWATRRLVRG